MVDVVTTGRRRTAAEGEKPATYPGFHLSI